MRTIELTPGLPSADPRSHGPELSVIAPALNEEDNVGPLVSAVREALGSDLDWELILVDDGSTDHSLARIAELQQDEARLRVVAQGANYGQTSALAAGFREARAPLIATLDADLQNDPRDIPQLLQALKQHDAVCGYRVERHDTALRRLSSIIANAVRNGLTGDHVRDTGCGLKLFRTAAIRSIPLFEGMHRFLPTLLRWHGYSVIEVPVSHHKRSHGVSKYGVRNRALRAFRDLIAVRWMRRRLIRPLPAERESTETIVPAPTSKQAKVTFESQAEVSPALDQKTPTTPSPSPVSGLSGTSEHQTEAQRSDSER
ncbi:MAG: dolichol-phosphate mannosyltransferase [Planctomycetota bacterium]|jgi:dolichol-phosphate mannosyltransferase